MRKVGVLGSDRTYEVYQLAVVPQGQQKSSIDNTKVNWTFDQQINQDFYPKQLNLALDQFATADSVEVMVLDQDKSTRRQIAFPCYLDSLDSEMVFAERRDDIPSALFTRANYLRVKFVNNSGGSYGLVLNWEVWQPIMPISPKE